MISNAGIIQVGPVADAQAGHFETALDTMALAPIRLALAALPVMRRQQHGRIVTIASIGGLTSDLLHLVQRLALPRPDGTGPDGTGPDGTGPDDDEATPGYRLDPGHEPQGVRPPDRPGPGRGQPFQRTPRGRPDLIRRGGGG